MARLFIAFVFFAFTVTAQPQGAARLRLSLDRLRTVGSVLMIAAHPDDENTALLAYFARGRHLRTAYLSLTRGEGGQNLIGSEQGAYLGVIRTHELLAARRLDGAEQYFTRAIDFGFSKTAEETLRKWDREQALGDIVWTIRRFQPDVIVLRFSGTPRDGHGHHQSSAMLGKEAFDAAADPSRFPEQLKFVQPWKARRVFWNVFSFNRQMELEAEKLPNRIEIDTGEYNPVLGASYGEVAGKSRSMHRSQAMGSGERKGAQKNHLVVVAGEPAARDPFDGIDTAWSRLPGGAAVSEALDRAARSFDIGDPSKMLPALIEARARIAAVAHPAAQSKLRETDELIAEAAGVWVDAASATGVLIPGSAAKVTVTALRRSRNSPVRLLAVEPAALSGPETDLAYNEPVRRDAQLAVPAGQTYTQPYWLRASPAGAMYQVSDPAVVGDPVSAPVFTARFRLRVGDTGITLDRPVVHRLVDPVRGELERTVEVVPPVAVSFSDRSVVFADRSAKKIEVQVRAMTAAPAGSVSLELPAGWTAAPASRSFALERAGESASLAFEVTPPAQPATVEISAAASVGGVTVRNGVDVIDYEHIPMQTLFPPARVRLVRADVKLLSRRIGYVMGAGDEVPAALSQIGAEVVLLSSGDLARGDLSKFDAVVTGVRAFNTRADLRANMQRLLDYVQQGGVMVVQYNVLEGGFLEGDPRKLDHIGPWPLRIGRDRVSVEEASMTPSKPDHLLLQAPNRITAADYDGWVQERGLYFAAQFDPRYESIWTMQDPGEPLRQGGTLFTRHGKGVYIFTPLSWFRQLPAGVPGAYRIFANFLSAAKVTP